MRLIDADALKEEVDKIELSLTNKRTIQGIIDNAPTVEYPFYQEAYQTGYEEGYNAKYERPTTRRIIVGNTTKHYACEMCESPIDIQDRYCRTCGAKIVENWEIKV